MDKEIKPLKRSEELAPLSREHHDGLLYAWKIKRGMALHASLDVMRRYTLWYWQNHIKPHFYQEEKILLPYMPDGHPMAKRLLEEHEHIRELVLSLDDEADRHSLVMLSDLVNQHIRFEERELFPCLEQLLSAEQLQVIFQELEAHPLVCVEWTEVFWLPS